MTIWCMFNPIWTYARPSCLCDDVVNSCVALEILKRPLYRLYVADYYTRKQKFLDFFSFLFRTSHLRFFPKFFPNSTENSVADTSACNPTVQKEYKRVQKIAESKWNELTHICMLCTSMSTLCMGLFSRHIHIQFFSCSCKYRLHIMTMVVGTRARSCH